MSIYSFISASRALYANGYYNEALCLVCIAADACVTKEYPDLSVSVRYKKFLSQHFRTICKIGFPGIEASCIRIKAAKEIPNLNPDADGYIDLIQIIYHLLRCGLVHDCEIEKTIEFIDKTIIGNRENDKFYLPKTILWGLISAVDAVLK